MNEKETIISDPSSLTLQMIEREIQHLHQLTFNRFDSIQRAIDLAHENFVRVPNDIQKEVGALRGVLMSKIENIYDKLETVESQRIEQKQDTAANVEKAFNSAKEAVKEQNQSNNIAISKSEMYVNAQLSAINGVINDLKERITKTEGVTAGIATTKTESRNSSSYIWGIVAIIASIVFGLIGVYMGTMLSK